jgi:hypothetical protein
MRWTRRRGYNALILVGAVGLLAAGIAVGRALDPGGEATVTLTATDSAEDLRPWDDPSPPPAPPEKAAAAAAEELPVLYDEDGNSIGHPVAPSHNEDEHPELLDRGHKADDPAVEAVDSDEDWWTCRQPDGTTWGYRADIPSPEILEASRDWIVNQIATNPDYKVQISSSDDTPEGCEPTGDKGTLTQFQRARSPIALISDAEIEEWDRAGRVDR